MPWKNSGGQTVEIALAPVGAGLGDFDWRVSMARVDVDGPFSTFAGVDRTLAIVDGEGLALSIDGGAPITLLTQSEPLSFPGDVATGAALVNGRVTDLNVMTRRGRFQHRVERLDFSGSVDMKVDATVTLLVCVTRGVRVEAQGGEARLAPLDTARLDGLSEHVLIIAESGATRCYLIHLERR
jgi:hypothetical protein